MHPFRDRVYKNLLQNKRNSDRDLLIITDMGQYKCVFLLLIVCCWCSWTSGNRIVPPDHYDHTLRVDSRVSY